MEKEQNHPVQFGKYQILEELGRGGFGTVYRVRETVLNVERAIKVLHPNLLTDETFLTRFKDEAQLSALLDHMAIVPVYEFGQVNGMDYIAMKYMPGGSLKELLTRQSKLSLGQTLRYFEHVCEGVSFAHKKGVIHRDLKPSNLLIDEFDQMRVSDFGFAKAIASSRSITMSSSGNLIGTPAYMAPEIWKGKPATVQSDIYSLGCILYEMLTGKILFEGESPAEVITRHVIEGPKYGEDLPQGMRSVLDKALHQDPAKRYTDAKELFEDVKSVIKPAVAEDGKHNNDSQPKIRTGALFVGVGVLIVLLVVFLTSGGFGNPLDLTKSSPPAESNVSPLPPTKEAAFVPAGGEVTPKPTQLTQESDPIFLPSHTATTVLIEPTATEAQQTKTLAIAADSPTYYPFSNCPPSQLYVGDSAYVSYNGVQISLRSEPVATIGNTLIRKLDEGEVLHVIDGPVCDNSLVLWKVRTVQNEFGWLPEGDEKDFWILPIATEKVCSGAKKTRLWVGATAFVEPLPKDRNIMYSEPAIDSSKELGRMNPGTYMQVLEGPSCGTGGEGVWWYVYSEQLKIKGWTRESSNSRDYYFIAPVISRP